MDENLSGENAEAKTPTKTKSVEKGKSASKGAKSDGDNNPAPNPPADADVNAQKEIDAASAMLSGEERSHLNSFSRSNPAHRLNRECHEQVDSFKPVTITFSNLRANSKVFLALREDQKAIWSEGDDSNRLVGLKLSSSKDAALYVKSFLINAREMYIQTYEICQEIEMNLYVRTHQKFVQGRVDLPPGASVTLQSMKDRTSIIGLSSFSIDVD